MSLKRQHFKIQTTLFRATDSYQNVPKGYGWAPFLAKPLSIFDIKANHFSLLIDAQAVRKIASKINL